MELKQQQQQQATSSTVTMKERYLASMILAGAGDAMGYKNGEWEFCYDGQQIHKEYQAMGGIHGIKLDANNWRVSDDTVMHLATAQALVSDFSSFDELMRIMTKEYIICIDDMKGRAPGETTINNVRLLAAGTPWNKIPFANSGGGCGGSMRATPIGLRFCGKDQRDALIAAAVESGRLTHNHPTGFFGSVVSAAFTALAVEDISPDQWGRILLSEILPMAKAYCKALGRDWDQISRTMHVFEDKWRRYLAERFPNGSTVCVFPENYGIAERDEFYKTWSYSGWAGASGDDSVIIAYDAILGAGDSWEELVLRAVLHGGDNDSTGTIAGAWFGALYGLNGVPRNNYEGLQYLDRLEALAYKLFDLRSSSPTKFPDLIRVSLDESIRRRRRRSIEQTPDEEEEGGSGAAAVGKQLTASAAAAEAALSKRHTLKKTDSFVIAAKRQRSLSSDAAFDVKQDNNNDHHHHHHHHHHCGETTATHDDDDDDPTGAKKKCALM